MQTRPISAKTDTWHVTAPHGELWCLTKLFFFQSHTGTRKANQVWEKPLVFSSTLMRKCPVVIKNAVPEASPAAAAIVSRLAAAFCNPDCSSRLLLLNRQPIGPVILWPTENDRNEWSFKMEFRPESRSVDLQGRISVCQSSEQDVWLADWSQGQQIIWHYFN